MITMRVTGKPRENRSSQLESPNWRSVPDDEQKMICTTIINELQHHWRSHPIYCNEHEYSLLDLEHAVEVFMDVIVNYFELNETVPLAHPSFEGVLRHGVDTGILRDGNQIMRLAHMQESMRMSVGKLPRDKIASTQIDDISDIEQQYYVIDCDKRSDDGVRYTYEDASIYDPNYAPKPAEQIHHIKREWSGGRCRIEPNLLEHLIAVDHELLSENVWLLARPLQNAASGLEYLVALWVEEWTEDGLIQWVEETSSQLTFPFRPWRRPHVVAHTMMQRAAMDFNISDRKRIRILEQAIRDSLLKIAMWNDGLEVRTGYESPYASG